MTQPQEGQMTQPQEGQMTQPQEGRATQPQEGQMAQAQEGRVTQPPEGQTHVTTTAAAPRRSPGQWAIVAVLGILGILALVAAILFIAGTANHIHFLSGNVHHGIHDIRLAVCIVVGVLLLVAAGYFARTPSKT
jgi:hypothetical protein